ncbi:response regulator transcription factor [Cereibacter azotoformans]|uniref:LuxR family two component transcriptional regulator n=1 Tax=Cereibacter azotoformans TaxID=43057 RepID=A0A2T5K7Y6_9RHOB|nr:response regulator transcription factor [Cereibacter azotoformans]AXQ94293.1 DNA-binding response regulator [Cereibacter sphaeroides]MBO4167890.1 response regulator transcription factor [Cereibacter azotoformans]PTR18452.1 LuxR family two component transcriptional regulator [Cereibacter azotoformans]UIJ29835.1 response regulator transcription factor [Cereibacter azotoformans]
MDQPETQGKPLSVLVADDQPLVRELILGLLGREPDMEVHAAEDLPDALEQMAAHGPFDVLLLDFFMPGMEGLEGIARTLAANGGRPVLLMSGNLPEETVTAARAMGVAGFVQKTQYATLAAAVRKAAAGDVEPAPPVTPGDLSAAEVHLLRELADGRSGELLADRMGAAALQTLFSKLGVSSRAQAVLAAKRKGLV